MEYIDVVNENDEVITNASKEDIYKKLLRHRIIHILLFNDKNEMALQLRSKTVSFCPMHWCTAVGGHVQSGESYEQAAIREYQEELGEISDLDLFSKDYYIAKNRPDKFLCIFKTKFNGPFNIDPIEVEKVEFFTIEKIKNMINIGEKFHPELLFILNKYFF